MRLVEQNELGEVLYQCDRCQLAGPKDSCIIEDNHQHYCLSCWYEVTRSRRVRREGRSVVIEV
jgi:CO dehydrogenase/acetyl-CoA synthase beta subunit